MPAVHRICGVLQIETIDKLDIRQVAKSFKETWADADILKVTVHRRGNKCSMRRGRQLSTVNSKILSIATNADIGFGASDIADVV